MAHPAQQTFCRKVQNLFPEYFDNVDVIDIGSLDINGNNHYLFSNYSYLGVDIGRGRNVNVVSKGHEFKPLQKVDTVISTECFEHDQFWDKTIINICENMLKPNGLFLFTCATEGRPEHGTRRTTAHDSPFTVTEEGWSDYYKNLTEKDVREAVDLDKYFRFYRFYTDMQSCDLYFWGIAW